MSAVLEWAGNLSSLCIKDTPILLFCCAGIPLWYMAAALSKVA